MLNEAYVKHLTPRTGTFLAHGYNLNKLGRAPLGDATYQNIKALGLVVSDKKIFSDFPYISQSRTCVCLFLFVLLLYLPSQQLWSLRDGQFT